MKRQLLVCAGMLWLAGCTTPGLSASLQLNLAKTETSIEAALGLAGAAYDAARPYLSPTAKATAKADIAAFGQVVHAARTAEKLGQASTLAADLANAKSLYTQITGITNQVTKAPAPSFPAN